MTLAAALIALLAGAWLTQPWWRRSFVERSALRRRSANVAAYRSRVAETQADADAGIVPAVDEVREELDARLLHDTATPEAPEPEQQPSPRVAVVLCVLLAGFAAAWYAASGSWKTQDLIELEQRDPAAARKLALDRMVTELRSRVAQQPDDAEGWLWLGRALKQQEEYAEAARAFERSRTLRAADDPDLLVDEAEALLFANRGTFAGPPGERLRRALALAPEHPRALWYGGLMALHQGDTRRAIELWERLASQDLPDDARAMLTRSLAQIRERAGLPAAPVATAKRGGVSLQVQVRLDPALAGQVRPGDALFLFAQDVAGGMPLAVRRFTAADIPLDTALDDTHAAMPTRKLSSADRWRLVARVSRSGDARQHPGDLEGSVEITRAQAGRPVTLTIHDQVK